MGESFFFSSFFPLFLPLVLPLPLSLSLSLTCRNQCVVLQTPLVDGSPCGYGGHCYNASCQAGPWQDRFEEMYTQNLQISIPVTIVVGIIVSYPSITHRSQREELTIKILLILFFLTRCLCRACGCCGPRKPKRKTNVIPPAPPMRNNNHHQYAYENNPPPPPSNRNSQFAGSSDPIYPQPSHNWNPQGQGGQNGGWVDESSYNGPYYGRQEAYGR